MCVIDGCDAKPTAKGLCAKHYMRQRRRGSGAAVIRQPPRSRRDQSRKGPPILEPRPCAAM
jgi:hypothetical protein